MKKHTRFLAWVMTLVMFFSCFSGTTAFAAATTAVDISSSADVCDEDHSDWTELTQDNIADHMFLYDQHYYLNQGGSYYLGTDLAMGVTIYIWPGDEVNLCLNGHDIYMTNSNRTILNPKNSATLNLYDCGTQVRYYDENGWVDTTVAGWDADEAVANGAVKIIGGAIYGASSFDKGGAGVFIQNYATFNMYGGNILGCSCSTTSHWGGGVYNYEGTFNMYRGVIAYNSSSTYAGGLFIRTGSTVNMYGGEIAYNYAPTQGAGVYSGGVFTMSGDASIHDNYGSYTGSGFYNAGGGTLIMEDDSSIYSNISGDGGSAGVAMPSYNSILTMSDNASITDNISTGIAAGVGFVSGEMTISGDAEVSGNYVVESVAIDDLLDADGDTAVTTRNGITRKTVGEIGDKVVDSNVYLYNGETITFDDFDGNDVYVTSANGLGLVATSVNDTEDAGNLGSDVTSYYAVREDETEVHLVLAQTLDGEADDIEYARGDIDLTDLDLFELFEVDSTYTIVGGTGVGTIEDEDLTVSSIGTFIIEAYTPHCNTNPPTWQTSTLTVTAKDVDIDDIGTIGSVVGGIVELDNTSGSIDGVVNDDDVSIDFTVAYGKIDDEDYTEGDTGKFDVSIHDISLTGEDAGNYTLDTVNDGDGTSVIIDIAVPHISWPTATDLVYGEDRDDDDLIGGTVVIRTNADGNDTYEYEDITEKGDFVWVTKEIDDAGTHTYEVQFVVDSDSEEEYDATVLDALDALEDLTHNVTQVVQAAEVTFTIANSTLEEGTSLSITVTDEHDKTLDSDDYDYLYYVDGAWVDKAPTAVGSYLIGASLTENYRHAGTQESTAKQIGAFEIYAEGESASTTYTVTFKDDTNDTEYTDYNITGALPQSIHILPTLDTDDYSAWTTSFSGSDVVYDFGTRFAQPEYNVVFTAVENTLDTCKLSGTITGTDLEGTADTELAGVVVTLMQGAEQIAVTTTNADGEYAFTVPEGRYNLVVTRDQVIRNEITLYVELNSDKTGVDVAIPDVRQNTIFNVASGMTAITVKGMEDLIDEAVADDEATVVSYQVELNPSSDTAAILAKAAEDNLTADNAKFYIDVSIQEREDDATGYEEIDLTGSDSLTLYIPLAGIYQGYGNYTVYFYDGEEVKELDDDDDDDVYFTVSDSGDLLTLHVQDSGVYGLAFWDTEEAKTGTNITGMEYTTDPISTATMFEDIESTGTRSYFITSTNGGVATIDANGYVTVTKVGTFIVTVKVAAAADAGACSSTATLTVVPKTVTISAITCDDQEADSNSTAVTLNETSGVLVGVETGDSVSINYANASGAIDDDDYTESDTLVTTGEEIFAVTVSGLALTGDDADNYILEVDDATITSQVTVTMSLVYIAWPTATDVTYGDEESKGTLYGGKVVVYNGITYADITGNGGFQWVATTSGGTLTGVDTEDTTIKVDAGTYTYDVQFVEKTTSNASYSTVLKNATQMVTQVVQPAAVTFVMANSTLALGETLSITVTDEHDETLDSADYDYLYYVNDAWVADEPTAEGSYLIGASLTSNYRHAGTQESTAKQIGAFTIGNVHVETYDVTFTGYEGDADYDITGALAQSIHILPTIDSDEYIGWLHEDGTTYDFGERFPQPEESVTFTAIAAPDKSATISGTVTGTDLNDVYGAISRVGVALYQGSTLVDYTTTSTEGDTLGTYSFVVVPGTYNLVITYDLDITTEITYFVDTTNESVVQDVTLPTTIQNTVLEVAAGLPDMVVNGLTDLLVDGINSEVLLEITSNTEADADIVVEIVATAAAHGISEDEIKQFFNIDLSSRTDEEPAFTAVNETDDVLTFYIPLTGIYQGHDEYTVYRYHEGEVQTLTTAENDDGEYIQVDNTNLIIHAKFFSLYGIAFANESSDTPSTDDSDSVRDNSSSASRSTYYDITVDTESHGDVAISPSRAVKNTEVTITPEPDDGYQVDTVTVTDSDGNSYTVTDQGDGTYTFTLPSEDVTICVTFVAIAEVAQSALPFTDVSVDDWFYEDVLYLYELGMMSGTTDTTFSPYVGNSRAMVAQLMYNLEGRPDNTLIDFFPDVLVGQWYEPAINWCAAHGVVDGYTDGLYRPNNIISKQEFASVLYDHCLQLGYDLSALGDLSAFADAPSDWAKTYIMWAVEAGLVQGDTNGCLNCSAQLTRCEAAAMFARFLRNVY